MCVCVCVCVRVCSCVLLALARARSLNWVRRRRAPAQVRCIALTFARRLSCRWCVHAFVSVEPKRCADPHGNRTRARGLQPGSRAVQTVHVHRLPFGGVQPLSPKQPAVPSFTKTMHGSEIEPAAAATRRRRPVLRRRRRRADQNRLGLAHTARRAPGTPNLPMTANRLPMTSELRK